MNAIDDLFQRLRSEGRKAFIPFITAGDPDLETSGKVVQELAARGAHLIEIGFPYSDPIADGAIIQASYSRALNKGVRVDGIFDWCKTISRSAAIAKRGIPLVAMVSYSLVHRRGPVTFMAQARDAGLSGVIIPDLPLEESETLARSSGGDFKIIHLVTPTTPKERAVRIAQASSGFLYYVSITGITGERDHLPEELREQIQWLRGQTKLPICVGFGISKPAHIHFLREWVDGVIIGSALVRKLEQFADRPEREVIHALGTLAQTLMDSLNPHTNPTR